MSQMYVTIAIKDADYLYVPVHDEAEASQMISDIEVAVNNGKTVTFNANNGRFMVNGRYIIRANYGTLAP